MQMAAGVDTRKKWMDGTRVEILKEIIDWINDPNRFMCRGSSGFTARPAGGNLPSLAPSRCSTKMYGGFIHLHNFFTLQIPNVHLIIFTTHRQSIFFL